MEKFGKFDLHVHSKHSKDAISTPASLCKEALKKGLAGFAITDHNSIASFQEFKKLQKQNKDFLAVLGEEVKIIENGKVQGELLCYFLQEKIQPASFGEILDSARKQNALVSVAHAFDNFRKPFRKDLSKEFKKVQAIETFNARSYTFKANKQALGFCERKKLPFTAGSDAHSLVELGKAGIECNAKSEEELRRAILKRKCSVFKTHLTPMPSQWLCTALARLPFK